MIYYFSGTGNSEWVAKGLAQRTGDTAVNLAALVKDGPAETRIGAGETIGLVFPVYSWGAPQIVEEFCKTIFLERGAYAYAVCTCGDDAGRAMQRLKRRFAYQSAWSIAMPNNYIIGFDVDSPALEREKIAQARERLDAIAKDVLSNKSVFQVHGGAGAGLKTALIRPLFNAFARGTANFSADAACNACGLCARVCPIGAIEMHAGKPAWIKTRCTMCTGCINRCPMRAIQYGEGTKKSGRYYMKAES